MGSNSLLFRPNLTPWPRSPARNSSHSSDRMGASDPVEEKEKPIKPLDAQDIAFLKHYGQGPYSSSIRKAEEARRTKRIAL